MSYFKSIVGVLVAGVVIVGIGVSFISFPAEAAKENKKQAGEIIPGQYIVVYKNNVDASAATDELQKKVRGLKRLQTYAGSFRGFAGAMSAAEVQAIKNDTRVAFVTEDRVMTIENVKISAAPAISEAQTIPTGIARIGLSTARANTGRGVGVAVVDTGIDLSHPDLKGNVSMYSKSCIDGVTANDDHGHGTHVAGTIAARNNTAGVVGVAPQAKLVSVKVFDKNGVGSWSSVICGIDWVASNASRYNIKVANLSLTGSGSSDNNCGYSNNDPVHQALCRLRDAGVVNVVAAGNSTQDTAQWMPAAYDDAVITVSALADSDGKKSGLGTTTWSGADDTFAGFSNYGSAVDMGAPGVDIYSTYKNGSYVLMSGTSMATPHVAGAAALYLKAHPKAKWKDVRDKLKTFGEPIGSGHSDPTGKHPEKVVQASAF